MRPTAHTHQMPAKNPAPPPDSRFTVMLVSSNAAVRENFCRVLAGQHLHLLVATCGEEALRFITEHKPDLIVTELPRSMMHGWDSLAHEEAFRTDRPIFVITTRTTTKTPENGLLAADLIQKPMALDAVPAAIRSHLDASQSRHLPTSGQPNIS